MLLGSLLAKLLKPCSQPSSKFSSRAVSGSSPHRKQSAVLPPPPHSACSPWVCTVLARTILPSRPASHPHCLGLLSLCLICLGMSPRSTPGRRPGVSPSLSMSSHLSNLSGPGITSLHRPVFQEAHGLLCVSTTWSVPKPRNKPSAQVPPTSVLA